MQCYRLELGLGWYGNYDGYDLAAIGLLSHGPPVNAISRFRQEPFADFEQLYLLSSFYNVRPLTVLLSLGIDVATTYIPFRLLRPLSRAHSASSHVKVPNSEIITSPTIQAYTTILAGSIYALVLYTAYVSYLPVYLVTYFTNIPTIEAAHSATPITLFPLTFLLGLAAKSFIFTPAVAAVPSLADAKNAAFNPQTATLGEHFWFNVWGRSKRTKVVIQRTATLMLVSFTNTFVQTYVTIEGVEFEGAIAYAAVWATAAGIAGAALGIVGAV